MKDELKTRKGMQDKTIKKILNWKLTDWVDSLPIKDEERYEILQNTIVTGGSIASMMLGEKINDFDIYFKNSEVAARLATHYLGEFHTRHPEKWDEDEVKAEEDRVRIYIRSSGILEDAVGNQPPEGLTDTQDVVEQVEKKSEQKYLTQFISENAITLSGNIQLIMRFCGDPQEIHKNFDYVHATCWYEFAQNQLHYSTEALRSLQTKRLVYRGSLYPICSLFRMRKFIERGWTISAGEILKMAMQISDLDLHDPAVLREQLTGVDYLYFVHLIRTLEEYMESNPQMDKIPTNYLITVIDKLFEE